MKHAIRLRSIRARYLVLGLFLSVGLYLIPGTLMAQQVNVMPLLSKIPTDIPGKEGLMIMAEYSSGGRKPLDLPLAPFGSHGKRHLEPDRDSRGQHTLGNVGGVEQW